MLPPSKSLDWYLGYLHSALGAGSKMPMWSGIKITEEYESNINGEAEYIGELIDFTDYYARFNELVSSDRAWINMSANGLLNGDLIISIEVPNRESEGVEYTSVNISTIAPQTVANNYNIIIAKGGS